VPLKARLLREVERRLETGPITCLRDCLFPSMLHVDFHRNPLGGRCLPPFTCALRPPARGRSYYFGGIVRRVSVKIIEW
jgi:hypothetical protein